MPLATICYKNQALKTIICFFFKLKTAAGRSFLRHSGSDVKTVPLYGDACSAKSFEVLPLIFITDCSPIGWLQSVLKIRSFENFFLSFLNFFQASRFGGRVDPLFHPPPHVLYSGTKSTSEVPGVDFGGWILGGGSLNFGLILQKKRKKK